MVSGDTACAMRTENKRTFRVKYWQLPQAVDEVLPQQASELESLRRSLLDLYHAWGYELVFPPLIEFSESLLTGLGADLELLTFKLTDQMTGRTLGLRADITPQVARIDAHSYLKTGVSRLCYAGTTLHTRPKTLMASRCPIQVGAELYGEESYQADIEIIRLMIATLRAAGVGAMTIDIGHVGVYQAVFDALGIGPEQSEIVDALNRKSMPDLASALEGYSPQHLDWLSTLMDFHGDRSVLARAKQFFAKTVPQAAQAIESIERVMDSLDALCSNIRWYFDLSELRGLKYHTGLVFAAYADGAGQALANGGRYDNVGKIYGRSRPATGFAVDLKTLYLQGERELTASAAISAPALNDQALEQAIMRLRNEGEVVITAFGGRHDERCTRELLYQEGTWTVSPIGNKSL